MHARDWRTWLLLGACVSGAAVWFLTTSRAFSARERTDAERQKRERLHESLYEQGQKEYARIDMTSLETFALPNDALEHLHARLSQDDLAAIPGAKDELLRQAAEFIYFRLMQESPEAYREWRESRGYKMKPASAMGKVHLSYERYFDRPMPKDDVRVFDDLFRGAVKVENQRGRPVAIANESTGIDLAVAEVDVTWTTIPTLSGEMAPELWTGAKSIGLGRNWFEDPVGGVHRVLHEQKTVTLAEFGFVVEMAKGDCYPFAATFFQDSADNWWLWRINAYNVEMGRLLGLEF